MSITEQVKNRFSLDDVKYLTLFADRLIPGSIRERFPKYKLFIKYFLEYFDKGTDTEDGVFKLIVELIRYFDLDYINENLTEKDDDGDYKLDDGKRIFNEFGENLIYSFYETFVGSKENRYLSTLMDDVQYLKRQKKINQMKGTKSSFLFFFLLVLGGYFKILNLSETKNHTGVWAYDGTLYYTDPEGETLEPYRYIVFSEFNPQRFSRILDTLNPAGMEPIFFIQKQAYIDLNDTGYVNDIDYYFENENLYIGIYNDDELLGLVKSYSSTGYKALDDDVEDYDFLTIDGRKWDYVISSFQYNLLDDSTGSTVKQGYRNQIDMMAFPAIVTDDNLSGEFNRIVLYQVNGLCYTETGVEDEQYIYSASEIDLDCTGSDVVNLIEYEFDESLRLSDINELAFILEV
jgi:hypothetical protein